MWGDTFTASLQNLWFGVSEFLPKLIIAVVLFVIGWVIARVLKHAVIKVCDTLKIDKLFESAGAGELMNKTGMRFSVGHFIGTLVKWFFIVLFLMVSLNILGLSQVTDFLRTVVTQYLPRVMVASLVLVIATIVADAAYKVISGSAKAMDVKSAGMLASIAKYAIWIFALIIALSELGIAPEFMQIFFQGVIYMIAIAGGLAFGLGGKDMAAKAMEKLKDGMSHHN